MLKKGIYENLISQELERDIKESEQVGLDKGKQFSILSSSTSFSA